MNGCGWIAIGILSVVLVGCGGSRPAPTTWRPVTAPNGQPAAWITCTQNQGACFEMAGKLCPYGYAVLRDDGSFVGESGQAELRRQTVEVDTKKKYEGHVFVQCRAPDHPPAPPRAQSN